MKWVAVNAGTNAFKGQVDGMADMKPPFLHAMDVLVISSFLK
jgi:hypothetical protein